MVVAIVLAVAFLGERPGGRLLSGGALIAAAVALQRPPR
jgi:drug/metabolite transporter (DMT)-like permease